MNIQEKQERVALLVAPESMQFNYDAFLLRCYLASLKARPQVVHPPQPTALATPIQTCSHPVAVKT